jgi:hypothetical protein
MSEAPNQFQVIYRRTDRLIVGLSPKGSGVGPDNRLAVIHDMNEYDNLMRFDPAYLSVDGDHIVGTPP